MKTETTNEQYNDQLNQAQREESILESDKQAPAAPWEMTKDDWHDEHLDDRILRRKYPHWSEEKKAQFGIPRDSDVVHREAVEAAIREGKPVPAEVLADYPELT